MARRSPRSSSRRLVTLVVLVAMVALAALSAVLVTDRTQLVDEATATADAAMAGVDVDRLVLALQTERAVALDGDAEPEDLDVARRTVDARVAAVDDLVASGRLDAAYEPVLAEVVSRLADARPVLGDDPGTVADDWLEELERGRADRPVSDAVTAYGDAVAALLAIAQIPETVSDAALAARLQAGTILGRWRESLILEAIAVAEASATDRWDDRELLVLGARAGAAAEQARLDLAGLGLDDVSRRVEAVVTSAEAVAVDAAGDAVADAFREGSAPDDEVFEPEIYQADVRAVVDALADVDADLASSTVALALDRRDDARRDQVLVVGGAVAAVAVLVGLGVHAAWSLDRRLERLTARVHGMAAQLPDALGHEPAAPDGRDMLLPVDRDDAVGRLAGAVNDLHAAAVRTVETEAEARRTVSALFVGLGDRSRQLLARQISLISSLEQRETDPDALEYLFRLDSLATQMRRHAESMLVLAGVPSPRRFEDAVPIDDVLRGAASEVEDYTRVRVEVRAHAAVDGSVAADLSHLFAELVEQALVRADDGSPVELVGSADPQGYLVAVSERASSLDGDAVAAVNARLEDPPPLAETPQEATGIAVAARLADRHGVRARIVARPDGGTTAVVLVPDALVVDGERQVAPPPARDVEQMPATPPAPTAAEVSSVPEVTDGDRPPLPPRRSGQSAGDDPVDAAAGVLFRRALATEDQVSDAAPPPLPRRPADAEVSAPPDVGARLAAFQAGLRRAGDGGQASNESGGGEP